MFNGLAHGFDLNISKSLNIDHKTSNKNQKINNEYRIVRVCFLQVLGLIAEYENLKASD